MAPSGQHPLAGLWSRLQARIAGREWEAMAKSDAMWAVASAPGRRRVDGNPWTEEEFYASGVKEVERYLALWGAPISPHATLLEVGCGLGRLTAALRKRVHTVYAVDVSDTMLQGARARLAGDPQVRFVRSEGDAFSEVPTASCDLAFSYICFQHMPRPVVRANLQEVARCLKPGGRAFLHVPVALGETRAYRLARWRLRAMSWLRRGVDPIANATGVTPMLLTAIPEQTLHAWANEAGLVARAVTHVDQDPFYAFHDFVKARG